MRAFFYILGHPDPFFSSSFFLIATLPRSGRTLFSICFFSALIKSSFDFLSASAELGPIYRITSLASSVGLFWFFLFCGGFFFVVFGSRRLFSLFVLRSPLKRFAVLQMHSRFRDPLSRPSYETRRRILPSQDQVITS